MTTIEDDPWRTLVLPIHRNLHADLADLAADLGMSVEAAARLCLSRGISACGELRERHATPDGAA